MTRPVTRLIATFLYTGHLSPASGTWGSLAALPVAWALHTLGGSLALIAGIVLAILLGWWATAVELRGTQDSDPSWIVIDEVAGMWIALLPVSVGAAMADVPILALWPGWVVAFLAFRLFDIWKPGPVGWADRRGDAAGVMLDDLIAGFFAGLAVIAGAAIAHGLMAL